MTVTIKLTLRDIRETKKYSCRRQEMEQKVDSGHAEGKTQTSSFNMSSAFLPQSDTTEAGRFPISFLHVDLLKTTQGTGQTFYYQFCYI